MTDSTPQFAHAPLNLNEITARYLKLAPEDQGVLIDIVDLFHN